MPPPWPSVLPPFRLVPEGSFVMGDDAGRADERPAHQVITRAVLFARTPVTNREYAEFVRATGRASAPFVDDPSFGGPEQPVVGITWDEAIAYCTWLTAETGRTFRLPTEAEWEKAARGGRAGEAYPWGDDPAGWSADPALGAVRQPRPYPVRLSRPNGYDLLDLGYNVHEWCSDWYDPAYYAVSPELDPRGPATGARRASRGGAWRHQIQVNRNAARSSLAPDRRYNDYGFRVVCDA